MMKKDLDIWQERLDRDFRQALEEVSAKAVREEPLDERELMLLALKHIGRDATYRGGLDLPACYFSPDVAISRNFFQRHIENERPAKALMIVCGQLGDTVWALPFSKAFKRLFPGCSLYALVWDTAAGVFSGVPEVAGEFVLEKCRLASELAAGTPPGTVFGEFAGFIDGLRSERFDMCVNLKRFPLAAFIAGLVQAPASYGEICDKTGRILTVGNLWNALLQSEGYEDRWLGVHRAEQMLRTLPQGAAGAYAAPARKRDPGQEVVIGLQVGSRMETKKLPTQTLAGIASEILSDPRARIVLTGGIKDSERGRAVLAAAGTERITDATGRTSIAELRELCAGCDAFVTTDTGPKHIAAFAGVPVVEISTGEDSLFRVGPFAAGCLIMRPRSGCAVCRGGDCPHISCTKIVAPKAVTQAVDLQKRLAAAPQEPVTLRKISAGLLSSPEFAACDLYWSLQVPGLPGITYFPLKESSKGERDAERVLNWCYVKMWERKAERMRRGAERETVHDREALGYLLSDSAAGSAQVIRGSLRALRRYFDRLACEGGRRAVSEPEGPARLIYRINRKLYSQPAKQRAECALDCGILSRYLDRAIRLLERLLPTEIKGRTDHEDGRYCACPGR